MRLVCNVQVNKKLGVGSGSAVKTSTQQACLFIAKQTEKNNDLYLFMTVNQNKQDAKYKINDNIQNVFAKFLNEGKATIRFKEPEIDLHIKCKNVLELKSFLHVLKMGIQKELKVDVFSVTKKINFNNTKQVVKKKVVVKSKAEYPVLEGFPRTTEELYICGLERKSFDRQILRLQSLRVLNLSNNLIDSMPEQVGASFPHLTEVYLSQNRLGGYSHNEKKWLWLNGHSLRRSLRLLDLSFNQMKQLPNQIGKLTNLLTLNVSNNEIERIPARIGNLPNLKFLDISNNKIDILPGTFLKMKLDDLDIIGNFQNGLEKFSAFSSAIKEVNNNCVPMLKECAARVVVNNRFFYDASIVPYTLINYLNNAHFCVCGGACFETYSHDIVNFNVASIARNISTDSLRNTDVPFHCIYCSYRCLNKFSKNRLR